MVRLKIQTIEHCVSIASNPSKMPISNFCISFKKYLVLLLCILYLLNPMQKQFAEGMHKFSHAFSHIDISHHHNDHQLEREHSHEHKMIAIFSKIFSSEEKTSDHDGVFFNYTLDKHFAQEYHTIVLKFKPNIKHSYNYTFHISNSVKTIPNPPPEYFFSRPIG